MSGGSRVDRLVKRAAARHERFERRKHEDDADGIKGGLICAMLDEEVRDWSDPDGSRAAARYQARFLEETTAVKAYIHLRKVLRTKFRAATWSTIFIIALRSAVANRKGPRIRRVQKPKSSQKLSPRTKAKQFMEKVQKGPINEESPAMIQLKAKQQQDIKTAENRMFVTGELTRLKELRAKTKLDDVEQEIFKRLEAKMQGMIVAAELERKEKEHVERKRQRKDRIKENEKNFLQSKMMARVQREERMRRLKAPIRKTLRALVGTTRARKAAAAKKATSSKYAVHKTKPKMTKVAALNASAVAEGTVEPPVSSQVMTPSIATVVPGTSRSMSDSVAPQTTVDENSGEVSNIGTMRQSEENEVSRSASSDPSHGLESYAPAPTSSPDLQQLTAPSTLRSHLRIPTFAAKLVRRFRAEREAESPTSETGPPVEASSQSTMQTDAASESASSGRAVLGIATSIGSTLAGALAAVKAAKIRAEAEMATRGSAGLDQARPEHPQTDEGAAIEAREKLPR